MMNVLSNQIVEYSAFVLKQCHEIKFAHGGHLFACSVGVAIHIFNFYTGDCPSNMICKGHVHRVRCIDWFQDDTGFASCDMSRSTYFYDLQLQRETTMRNQDKDFNQRTVSFTGVCNVPRKPYEVLVVGSDNNVWHVSENKHNCQEAGVQLSQVNILSSGKVFFGGVGQEGRPGAIQIWRFNPLEKITEV